MEWLIYKLIIGIGIFVFCIYFLIIVIYSFEKIMDVLGKGRKSSSKIIRYISLFIGLGISFAGIAFVLSLFIFFIYVIFEHYKDYLFYILIAMMGLFFLYCNRD